MSQEIAVMAPIATPIVNILLDNAFEILIPNIFIFSRSLLIVTLSISFVSVKSFRPLTHTSAYFTGFH